ncbi:hypothetical protein F4824DRAFT_516481 [Ustulina deusta]|nr:hypothetical protein F4824DRAFT_516481 [Ustulina deusta]
MSLVITQAPDKTIHYKTAEIPHPRDDEVLVRFLASPVNPLDLLVIKGNYPVRPKYNHSGEAILGYEGVGEIVACGINVTRFQPGDLVIPSQFGLGTWRSYAAIDASLLLKIHRPNDVVFAALLRMAIAPSYFLVEDIRDLKPGECIIQNAGTSAVAQYVTQFAARRGVSVISVIRDRSPDETQRIKNDLLAVGAEKVFTESELATEVLGLRKSKKIVLALDSVYGTSSSLLLNALSDGGTFVHLGFLGGNSGKLELGPQDLFGRRLTLRGFRGSDHMAARSIEEQTSLLNHWVAMFNRNELKLPVLDLSLIELNLGEINGQAALDAVQRAQEGAVGQGLLLIIFGVLGGPTYDLGHSGLLISIETFLEALELLTTSVACQDYSIVRSLGVTVGLATPYYGNNRIRRSISSVIFHIVFRSLDTVGYDGRALDLILAALLAISPSSFRS